MNKLYFFIFFICYSIANLLAQSQIPFSHLGINDGLSQSTVFDITQDTKGNMWFATFNGVNKYNGYDFTVYLHEEGNQYSIGHNTIRTVEAGDKGKVWIGTDEGLSCYNPEEDSFHNYHYKKAEKCAAVIGIVNIDKEHLLVNTSDGLILFNIPRSIFLKDKLDAALFQLRATSIHRFQDRLYIGTSDGVFAYSLTDHTLHNLITFSVEDQKEVLTILQQSDSRLWIGTEGNGLYCMNLITKEVKHYKAKDFNSISSDFVRSLALDSQNRLWVGTFTSLDIYDEEKDQFTAYINDRLQEQSLSQSSIRSVFKDSQGGMWLGTYFGGINYYHTLKDRFRHLHFMPHRNSLNDNVIGCITKDRDGSLWIGTNNGGVNKYNPTSGIFTYYTTKQGLGANDVKAIYIDEATDKVYIGAHTGGLNILHRKTGKIESYTSENSLLPDNNVYAILPSNDKGQLWLGTLNGLVSFDLSQQKFIGIATDVTGKSIEKKRIRDLLLDSKQRLWIGGENGIAIYSFEKGKLTPVSLFHQDTGLENAFIYCLYESENGVFWIGTRNGLFQFNEKENKLKHYDMAEGLPNSTVYGILEDRLGRLWISTDKGLSCFHPESDRFRNFTSTDGLQSNQFTPKACCRMPNGEMYFGGINGLSVFQPEQMRDNPYVPSPVITDLEVFNIPVLPHDKTGILDKHISETEAIVLQHEQSSFALNFIVSNYIAGHHNTFAYKLEGYDKEWYHTDGNHHWATYTNLPAGNYTFLVKAANNDGKWNETPASLSIRILPVWYLSWWAITLFSLILVGIAVLAFRFQMERLNKKRYEELQEMKTRFFIDISHELRTPLTLILAPLQELINRVDDRWMRGQLDYIMRNTNRLLHLVNQLMDYRRAEKGVFQLKVCANDAYSLVEKNFRFYEQLAKRKQIVYNLQSNIIGKKVLCDANYLELILNNLLSNAFKYTNTGQSITIMLNETGTNLLLQVKDTGAGIPIDKQAKIFERFYQIEKEHIGSGIGLSLVQKLVELHHGRIELESTEHAGSCFSIYLPTHEEAYRSDERTNEDVAVQAYSTNAKDMYMIDAETAQSTVIESDSKIKKETILIVEDNEEIQHYLSEELSKFFITLEAENGEEALEIIKENEIDLIITDVMMPVMDGIKLCRSIKQNLKTCHIPVIILSAKSELKDQMEGLQVGADDYMAKPFSLSLLVTKIKNILRTHYRSIEHYANSLEIEPEKIALNPLDEEFLKKALVIVEKHMDDLNFSTDEFARDLYMSRSALHMKMKAVTGESTAEFIRKIRFNHACKLLKEGRYNVAEISLMVGFNTPSYFATCFKKYIGCLPSEYGKNGGNQQN